MFQIQIFCRQGLALKRKKLDRAQNGFSTSKMSKFQTLPHVVEAGLRRTVLSPRPHHCGIAIGA